MKHKGKWIAVAAAALVVLTAAVLFCCSRRDISVIVEREDVSYVICYSRGLGPRRLDYAGYPEVLDALFDALSGEYAYVRRSGEGKSSGGGPYTLSLYRSDGVLIETYRYLNGRLYLPAILSGNYRVYRNKAGEIDFSEFERCLDEYGVYQ